MSEKKDPGPEVAVDVMNDALTAALAASPGPTVALIGLKMAVQALADVGEPRLSAVAVAAADSIATDFIQIGREELGNIGRHACEGRERNATLEPALQSQLINVAARTIEQLLQSVSGPFEVLVVLAAAKKLAGALLFEGMPEHEVLEAKMRLAGIENHFRRANVQAVMVTDQQLSHMTRGGQA